MMSARGAHSGLGETCDLLLGMVLQNTRRKFSGPLADTAAGDKQRARQRHLGVHRLGERDGGGAQSIVCKRERDRLDAMAGQHIGGRLRAQRMRAP